MGTTKADIELIIKGAVNRQITILQAVADSDITINVFYHRVRKYGLKIPKYKTKHTCPCGETFFSPKGGGTPKLCPECRRKSQAKACADWRKRNPGYKRPGKADYFQEKYQRVAGWTYNEKYTRRFGGVCIECQEPDCKLNRCGLCKRCYEWIDRGMADAENPFIMAGSHRESLSERPLVRPEGL